MQIQWNNVQTIQYHLQVMKLNYHLWQWLAITSKILKVEMFLSPFIKTETNVTLQTAIQYIYPFPKLLWRLCSIYKANLWNNFKANLWNISQVNTIYRKKMGLHEITKNAGLLSGGVDSSTAKNLSQSEARALTLVL